MGGAAFHEVTHILQSRTPAGPAGVRIHGWDFAGKQPILVMRGGRLEPAGSRFLQPGVAPQGLNAKFTMFTAEGTPVRSWSFPKVRITDVRIQQPAGASGSAVHIPGPVHEVIVAFPNDGTVIY